MDITGATLFSGGEGVGVAMRAAGIRHLQGLEWNDSIASVARLNGFNTKTGDVRSEDYSTWERPTILHASPVCKNASNAKPNGGESAEDIETADAVCRAIVAIHPRVFTLENVWGYRHFQAFKNILKCLKDQGYQTEYWHLNSSDFGVPQTRKRLILVAALDFKPYRPQPTHDNKYYGGFSDIKRWVGWYEAIEDLIPTLPESKFANWQLERLPKHLTDVLIGGGNRSHSFLEFAKEYRPDTPGKLLKNQPSQTVSATASGDMRAFLTDGKLGSYSTNMTVRDGDERFIAVTTSHNQSDLKGFIVNTREQHAGGDVTAVEGDKPVYGLVASSSPNRHKAFLMPNENTSSGVYILENSHSHAITASHGVSSQRAWLDSGRVVKMTPRALARFQSFPDSYILPSKRKQRKFNSLEKQWFEKLDPESLSSNQSNFIIEWLFSNDALACEIIGNAVPCLLYQQVIEAQIDLFR